MLNRPKFLLLIVFLFCLHYCSIAQDIHFTSVKKTEELSGRIILGITQDQQGFLWLATTSGLYKYDGHQYTAYLSQSLNPNAIESNYIECVTSVKDGSIWIGHYLNGSKGAERLDPTTGIFTHYHHSNNDPSSIASDNVSVIMQDHEGTIWIGTNNGLDRFNSKTNTFTHYKHNQDDSSSLSSDGVRVLYEDKQGVIWVGTGNATYTENPGNEGGLNKLDRQTGKFTRFLHKDNDPHSLMDNRVRALFEDSRGNFWVGTGGDGLHIMNRKNGTFERYLFNPAHPDKLSRPPVQTTYNFGIDHITFITEDTKGRILIGTFEGGINVWDPAAQKITYYGNDKKSKELLQDEFFWAAYKTKDGVIWISAWGGNLYKINPYETQIPHTHLGGTVLAFTEDNTNLLWMATLRGLVSKDSSGKMQRILLDKNLASYKNSISYIAKNNANQLWLATFSGLYSFDPVTHNLKGYHHENGNANSLLNDSVTTIKTTDGGLWVGTYAGLGWLDTKTGMFKNYLYDPKDSNSISGGYIFGIVAESNGDLWVATSNGLNRFNKQTGHFKNYLKGIAIFCVIKDSKGDIWAATELRSITKYNREKDIFLDYTDATGLLKQGTLVYYIVEDNQRNLWFHTAKGIIELDTKTNQTILYGKNQGINSGAVANEFYVRKNGEVLLGDTSGYFSFNDQLLKKNIPPPVVNITNFSLADAMSGSAEEHFSNLINQQKDIRLSHDQNVFSIQFSSVDFISAHEDTRLLYMLENYDNNWRNGNNDPTAYYFNVPPGQYVFKVKAANVYGIWAEKEITIIVNPPWWSTWWAYCLYAICFLSIAFFANRIIRNRIIEKERMKNKEKELAQAKEIEKAYHELKSTQQQLIQSEKMASLGELTAGIAHEIQNPLNFVNNFSDVNKELLEEMKVEMSKGNIDDANDIANDVIANEEKINHHGKRAEAIVKGMLQHSRTSSGQKELTDLNALADEYLRLSYHGLRAKDKNFNADIKTDFDESIGNINIIPQDIGRVLLNLYNNAFYAVAEKKKQQPGGYAPTVSVITKKIGDKISISVIDNGNGIPQKIVDKIFQPFFTTKPTGQGTGLGLSLSYDIVKAHGGEIKVETKEGEGTEFIIELTLK